MRSSRARPRRREQERRVNKANKEGDKVSTANPGMKSFLPHWNNSIAPICAGNHRPDVFIVRSLVNRSHFPPRCYLAPMRACGREPALADSQGGGVYPCASKGGDALR